MIIPSSKTMMASQAVMSPILAVARGVAGAVVQVSPGYRPR